ncbi:LamG-like jellyroll fold domain-containing protein [Phytohabitans aurantiacus]|nr:LamG-like jellyroll fold domain-containing protein [Phytohabitans aurantiacus]
MRQLSLRYALRRWLMPALVLVLAASLLPASAVVTSAPPQRRAVPIREASDLDSAVRAAAVQGSPVRVAELTTQTRTVDAQPDGTMKARLSARIERVQRDGRWVGVDTTLVRRPDGSVVPRAVDVDLVLSGGGAKVPLVRYGREGKHIGLTWPGRLPAPTLSGPTATYANVLPGVDLVLRASVSGYAQYLVVKDAKAARNPALRQVRLGLASTGLRLAATRTGALEARDTRGAVLFAAPPSVMWDSRPGTRREARVGVAVGGGALTLRPDRGMLADPATVYPVTIDPVTDWLPKSAWATILSGLPNNSYWNSSADPGGNAQVGRCHTGRGNCNGIGVARSYFQFETGFLAGKQLFGAAVNITAVHSAQCGGHVHQLFRANNTINPGTTWNNHPPGWLVRDVGQNACTSPALGFDAMGSVNTSGATTYFIKAADENNMDAWRRYDANSVSLYVHFNSRPDVPSNLRTDPPLRAPCTWCGGVSYVGDANIRLMVTLTDPDRDMLRPMWRYSTGVETAWNGGMQVNGATHDANIPLDDKDGKYVGWWVHGSDDSWGSDPAHGTPFVVDRRPPATKPGVTGILYPADNRWHGGVDVPGEFTFDAAGVSDIDHYLYGWQDPPATKAVASALGGPATLSLTPPGDGPRTLYVQSVDRAGHKSPTTAHRIYVRAGNGPLAQWSLDGNAEDTAFLGDRDGTLTGGGVYQPGAVGTALKLDGAGHVYAPNTVRTDASFTVSAWARLDALDDQHRTVVSQHGANTCSFCIQYQGDKKAWVFVMPQADSANPPGWDQVLSKEPAVVGEWTHLAGVYDAARKEIRLYVNGVLAGTAPRVRSWHGADALRIGVGLIGAVDEVKVYDRLLSDAQIRAEVSTDNVQVGHWKLDETEGASAVNAVPDGPAAVLHQGATFTKTGGAVGGAVQIEGTGHATTAGPVLRTDRAYSVAAWARLGELPPANDTFTALSQDGNVVSAFHLGYRNSNGGRWELFSNLADTLDRPAGVPLQSSQAYVPRPDEWTHLAAVYDPVAKQVRLYVGGQLAGVAARATAFHATGPFVIGRGKWDGVVGNYWRGAIDEVRAYSRVLSDAEIQGIVAQSGVTAGAWRLDGDVKDATGGVAGAVYGGADWTGGQSSVPDPSDLALRLGGETAYAEVPRHAVNTSRSFSATAWARLDKVGGHYGVVSQDGATTSAFKIEADPGGAWSFAMFTQDVNGGGEARRAIGGTAQVGVWTHLTAVYDAGKGLMSLYVNGVLAASRPHTNAWDHPAGKLQIGRNKWQGGPVDYFPGAIDDVSVYNRPLFVDEIRTLAGRDLTLVHNWALDESSGTSTADVVGGRRGTLSGGASFAPGRVGNAVRLDGRDDAVSTAGVDLRTDASFTVTAWVHIGSVGCDLETVSQCKSDAVTLDGERASKFRMGHIVDDSQHPSGAWFFEMPEPDGRVTKAVVSSDPEELIGWAHLTGVYDAPSRKIWLYVDGKRIGDGTLDTPWHPDGGLQIGRGKVAGAAAEFWPGLVDDVRLYTGVLDKDRVLALYRSYPAEDGPAELPVADAGHWRFDEATGTTAADASGKGRTATLKGGAGWSVGRQLHAASLNGTSGYADTAGPVLDTSRDFSVAAWVHLTNAGTANKTVLGQDGARVSSFHLMHEGGTNTWSVAVPDQDRDNPNTVVLRSSEPAALGDWTHLAVVYRTATRQLRLYVNGVLSAARVDATIWSATGPLSIGRSKWNGANSAFFPGGVDELRAYGRALSDGEVRRVHDDVAAPRMNAWRFDDRTGRDYTAQQNNLTVTGATYMAGVDGTALTLDGVDDAAASASAPLTMRDSFTVSAWARLSRTDKVSTVVGQDGARMSGFALQYRPGLKRWVFAAPLQDADSAELVYAASLAPAQLGRWTHLTGVYDYPARQLRLYVDGKLAEIQEGVTLWRATGSLTVGRGRFNGAPADFFPGEIDEVTVAVGRVADAEIARQAGWPAPVEGQLGRFVNGAGEHYTGSTSAPVRDGYRFEGTLGTLVTAEHPNTLVLYSCRVQEDYFTSRDPACEGQTVVGEIGRVYTQQPTNLPTVAVYRCWINYDHFETRRSDCEGGTNEGVIGYTLAYAPLPRYYYDYAGPVDHLSTVDGAPPGYQQEGPAGLVALSTQPGTVTLMSCLDGTDFFVSTDPACEGKQALASTGRIWTAAPDGVPSRPVYRCVYAGQRYVSLSATCEGYTMDRLIGHVLVAAPDTAPVFGS